MRCAKNWRRNHDPSTEVVHRRVLRRFVRLRRHVLQYRRADRGGGAGGATVTLDDAVELHGGLWSRGAHSRPQGIQRDMNKANFAVMNGWRVLYFSTQDIETDPESCIAVIRQVVNGAA